MDRYELIQELKKEVEKCISELENEEKKIHKLRESNSKSDIQILKEAQIHQAISRLGHAFNDTQLAFYSYRTIMKNKEE